MCVWRVTVVGGKWCVCVCVCVCVEGDSGRGSYRWIIMIVIRSGLVQGIML